MEEHAAPLGPALKAFDDTYRRLPYGGTIGLDAKLLHSWETHLLPYLGHEWAVWHKMDFSKEWYRDHNGLICKSIVMDFIRPDSRASDLRDADGFGLSHFAANSNIMAGNLAMKLSDLRDGGSNTILIGEVNIDYRPWGHPANWRDPSIGINHPHGFGGASYTGGATFVFADGSVRVVSDHVSPAVLKALSVP
jgi:prepilin-type processing-associated H-X9-DG protein